jgi:NAD(P)-dependent dehydrogenase (short-subunit alcohol dehydrogenase family)
MTATIIITGGGRGIGAATAVLAAARGYRVLLSYRDNRTAAEAVAARIAAGGGTALAVQADAASEADTVRLFATCDSAFGRPDAVVINAGIVAPAARVDAMDADRIRRLFETNVVGAFVAAREAVKRMSTRHGGQGGAIVTVSSAAARLGASGEYVDYAATKGAIDTFTVGLAKEVATEGIRVNAVRPGVILTEIHASGGEPGRAQRVAPMVPMQRAGEAEEVARSILWLASAEASYITGALLDVSGGR